MPQGAPWVHTVSWVVFRGIQGHQGTLEQDGHRAGGPREGPSGLVTALTSSGMWVGEGMVKPHPRKLVSTWFGGGVAVRMKDSAPSTIRDPALLNARGCDTV